MDKDQKRFEQIEKLTRMMPIIIGVVAVGYMALFYFFVLMPKLGRIIEGGTYDLTPIQAVYDSEVQYQKVLVEHLERIKAVGEADRNAVEAMVPVGYDFPGLVVTWDTLAQRNNLALVSLDVAPQDTALSGGRESVSGTVSLAGGDYVTLKALLRDVEFGRRVMDIESLNFSAGGNSVSLNFRAYYIEPTQAQ